MPRNSIQNFGRNVCFHPDRFASPQTVQGLLGLLNEHPDKQIRAVGSRHAWSDAIITDDLLIDMRHFDHVEINPDRNTVTVGGGCQIKSLLSRLKEDGLTLPSVGLIDEQTIAGATATGTHGSGKQSLSHFVSRVQIAHFSSDSGQAKLVDIDSGDDLLAARCSLGLMGVVVEIEIQTRPCFRVQEHVRRHPDLASVLDAEKEFPLQQFFFMPWSWHFFAQHRVETDLPCSRLAGLYSIYWHLGIDWGLHLIIFSLVRILRAKYLIRAFFKYFLPLVIARRWRVTAESQKIMTMEHELFRHIEIEIFVTRNHLPESLKFIRSTISDFGSSTAATEQSNHHSTYVHHYPICVRRVLPDETLISMSSPGPADMNQDWYAISLISYNHPDNRQGFFQFARFLAERMQNQFGARCHWGKVNPLDQPANKELYPGLACFRAVASRFDPEQRMANKWLKQTVLDPGPED